MKNRGADNGKYALVTYLIERKKLSIEQIINLKPQETLEFFSADDKEILVELKKYITKNSKNINEKDYFFPGRGKEQVSERALLQELHFWLKKQGRSLEELGLQLKQSKRLETPIDILQWAREQLK